MIDNSPVFEKIKKLLDQNLVEYQLFEHEPVFTSEQAAKVRNTDIEQGAKAIVFSADPAPVPLLAGRCGAGSKPILIVVPGDRRVDLKTFKKTYNVKDLRILSPEEIKEITGLEIGAIPPFGNVMNLPTFVDEKILENETIVFNAGAHTKSVQMRPQDYLKLCQPTIGNFSVENVPTLLRS